MDHGDQLVFRILRAARAVHSALGPGFIENIYARALIAELTDDGFQVQREKTIKIWYGTRLVGKHRLDLIVDSTVILELKANHGIVPLHIAQMKSYLHATGLPFGLLLNFGVTELQWEVISSGTESAAKPSH